MVSWKSHKFGGVVLLVYVIAHPTPANSLPALTPPPHLLRGSTFNDGSAHDELIISDLAGE